LCDFNSNNITEEGAQAMRKQLVGRVMNFQDSVGGVRVRGQLDEELRVATHAQFNIGGDDSVFRINKTDLRFGIWADFLKRREQSGLPVFVDLDTITNEVVTVLAPFMRKVRFIAGQPEGSRLSVTLLAAPASFFLNTSDENFGTFRSKLEREVDTGNRLLITAIPGTNEIVDVRDLADNELLNSSITPNNPGGIAMRTPNGESARMQPAQIVQKAGWPDTNPLRDVVSLALLKEIFDRIVGLTCTPENQPNDFCIPFRYILDGCTARAHQMCTFLVQCGIRPRKIWHYASGFPHTATLCVRDTSSGVVVPWQYHVAPVVSTDLGNAIRPMVVDPALFDAPASIGEWIGRQPDLADSRGDIYEITDSSFLYREAGDTVLTCSLEIPHRRLCDSDEAASNDEIETYRFNAAVLAISQKMILRSN
jgi:hypothetical protein